jgi:hypothetical protein
MKMDRGAQQDEVDMFMNARYVSASEAYWRIYDFKLHKRDPPVEKLPCHLPDQQTVLFETPAEAQAAINRGPPETKLTAYFKTNRIDAEARTILYIDFPRYFTWNATNKQWQRRKQGNSIGRIPTISLSPHQAELFYLRMLLFNRAGATGFEELRTIEDTVCPTFQDACRMMGLLDDDNEINQVMEEAYSIRFGSQLRDMFATILMYCRPSDPASFWERHKSKLCEDLMHQNRVQEPNELIVNEVLLYLQDRLQQEGLDINCDFGLPQPNPELQPMAAIPRDIREETMHDFQQLEERVNRDKQHLTDEQRLVYEAVMDSVENKDGSLINLDAPGGTGKTFTINLILDSIRSKKMVALAMASSGIAATLLHNGRTIHSRLKVPLAVKEESTCQVSKRSATGRLLAMARLLIIDEISMSHKHVFECIDRTCQDIRGDTRPFGGLTVLLSGDYRQILPVVPRGSRVAIVNAALKASYLWPRVRQMKLCRNMRVEQGGGK